MSYISKTLRCCKDSWILFQLQSKLDERELMNIHSPTSQGDPDGMPTPVLQADLDRLTAERCDLVFQKFSTLVYCANWTLWLSTFVNIGNKASNEDIFMKPNFKFWNGWYHWVFIWIVIYSAYIKVVLFFLWLISYILFIIINDYR